LNAPIGIAVHQSSGFLYVVDSDNSLIRQINPSDEAVLTKAGTFFLQPDYQDGQSSSASFKWYSIRRPSKLEHQ
jgi:hypothetical protein